MGGNFQRPKRAERLIGVQLALQGGRQVLLVGQVLGVSGGGRGRGGGREGEDRHHGCRVPLHRHRDFAKLIWGNELALGLSLPRGINKNNYSTPLCFSRKNMAAWQ